MHSSVAMAKAALEAINGVNMFGEEVSHNPHSNAPPPVRPAPPPVTLQSSSLSVIHVDPDAHYRNLSILSSLLPKESSSKVCAAPSLRQCVTACLPPRAQDTDAALLCVLGFPAFAIDNKKLARVTYDRVLETLEVCPMHYVVHTCTHYTHTFNSYSLLSSCKCLLLCTVLCVAMHCVACCYALFCLLLWTVLPVAMHCFACCYALFCLLLWTVLPVATHCFACCYALCCLLPCTVLPVAMHCVACCHALCCLLLCTVLPVAMHCVACCYALCCLLLCTVLPVAMHCVAC